MTPLEEAAWVVRAQCGDRDALEQLLRRIQPPLHRYVSRIVGPTPADDVVQKTLIAVALGAQILFVAGCTAVVMMHVTRMTKAILRALELKK